MEELRRQIDQCDDQIMMLLNLRFALVKQVGTYKRLNQIEVEQPERMQHIISRLSEEYGNDQLDEKFIQKLYDLIMGHAVMLER